jgi:hypothetical protein
MEQDPYGEANSCSASLEEPPSDKSLSLVPILKQMKPVHSFPPDLRTILIIYSHLYLDLPNGLFPSSFSTLILNAFLIYNMCAT